MAKDQKLEKYKEIDKELQMVPITFDYVFKQYFKTNIKELKEILLEILEIELPPEECEVKFLDNELPKDNKNEYKKTIDIYICINNKFYVDIEVNRNTYESVRIRNNLYLSKLFVDLLKKGANPKALEKIKLSK